MNTPHTVFAAARGRKEQAKPVAAGRRRGGWITLEGCLHAVLLFFAATLPLYYDLSVPEVSGDIRWMATSFFAGLAALLVLAIQLRDGKVVLSLRGPVIFWFAAGVSVWAAVSLIDALNWMRGIILIKALYAQLVLMACVYFAVKQHGDGLGFARRLVWALVLPLGFTSFLGICQFHGWNGQIFMDLLHDSSVFFWLAPVFDGLGAVTQNIHSVLTTWPDTPMFVDQIMGYFQQSAVPGSTFANKNLAGSWTAMMLPLALYLLVTAKGWRGQAGASLLLTLGSLFLMYSRARASWVALFASLLTLAALVVLVPAWRQAVLRHVDWKHLLWLLLPVLVLVKWGGDISPIKGAHAVDRTPGEQIEALAGSSWDEIGGRVAYNTNSLAIIKDYWFNGVGLGSFFTIYPAYYDALVVTPKNSYNISARPQRTHTDLMQAFDEMGLVGGICFAGVFMSGIMMAFRLAGRTAGRLGNVIAGGGMLLAVFSLTVFLEYKDMLAMPMPWNWLVQLIMLVGLATLAARAVLDIRTLQQETKAADDMQLLGLMAGIGLLSIGINATMDFPMQLPTAPAAAMFLLGIVTALFVKYCPAQMEVGPAQRAIALKKPVLLALLAVVTVVWGVFLYDAYKFRQGNAILKAAMVRIFSGINDDNTLMLVEAANMVYPYDPRIHENMAVAYANYSGSVAMPIETRVEKIEKVVAGDPWGANHIVNMCGQYLQLAESKQIQGDMAGANKVLERVEELYARLLRVADGTHFTYGVGGMLRLLQGRNQDAAALFQRALEFEPTYGPALNGLQIANQRMGMKPLVIKDALTGK